MSKVSLIPNSNLLSDNKWRIGNKVWEVPRLIRLTKEQKLKPFKLYLNNIDLDVERWNNTNNIFGYATHMKRVLNTELKYPIILDYSGCIIDGWHRIVKALIEGKEYINAVRFKEYIEPDYIEEDDKNS